MRAHLSVLALSAALAGCEEYQLSSEADVRDDGDVFDSALDEDSRTLRLDVYPDGLDDEERGIRYLPQTFTPGNLEAELTIELRPSVVFEGDVVAWHVTPWAGADLPGTDGPVGGATVSVWQLGTVHAANATTADAATAADGDVAEGSFAIEVVPGNDYQVAVVPNDPTIPFYATRLSLASDTAMTFELDYGAAVYGTITDGAGKAMKGVGVYAVGADEVVGATAVTDDAGRYLLRVQPGDTYRVVADGRGNGREPRLTQGPVEVTADGLEVPFVYPNTSGWSASGRIVDADARPIENVEVVFTAVTLDGFPLTAEFSDTVVTNAEGNFDTTRLLAGTYHMEVRPRAQHEFTPVYVGMIVVDEEFESLETLTLPSFQSLSGQVRDERDAVVPGSILVFTEIGYGGRSWQAAADEDGQFFVSLPRVFMEVTITPPHGRDDLAITRYNLDPATDVGDPTLVVHEGVRIHGTIQTPDGPAASVLVEARDPQGRRWGTALTDERGRYEMQVAVTTP